VVRPVRVGSFGRVRAEIATPLAVVLSELVQNAVEHGLHGGPGLLEVRAERTEAGLRVEVADDGVGLPADFDLATSERLGLQIVRTLVESELDGTLRLGPGKDGGTVAVLDVPAPT
jgi:two-component sensor histidine kinase